jgi:uncharacterized protein YndB with AHSA1/START domain
MTSLTMVRRIKAKPQKIFNAFIDPRKIALWWGPDAGPVIKAEVDARLGGRFHVRFRMKDGSEHGSTGIFEAFDPPHHLAMSWTWESEPSTSHIDVKFREIPEGTEMTFAHSRLKDEASRDDHTEGWNGAFDKLEAKAGEL